MILCACENGYSGSTDKNRGKKGTMERNISICPTLIINVGSTSSRPANLFLDTTNRNVRQRLRHAIFACPIPSLLRHLPLPLPPPPSYSHFPPPSRHPTIHLAQRLSTSFSSLLSSHPFTLYCPRHCCRILTHLPLLSHSIPSPGRMLGWRYVRGTLVWCDKLC